ncbi:MAG: AMP-binding protein [Alphaproteobacteria bacterium]|nr:AMP-binding protein [Alphaproteobacteria bacterium]
MTTDEIETWPGYREIPERLNITAETLDKQIASGNGASIAFKDAQGSISYAELNQRVCSLATGLRDLGISKTDHVLIRLPNCIEFIVSFLALVKLGAVPVLQNSLLGASEVAYVREHSDAVAAITLDDIAEPVRTLSAELPRGIIVARGSEAGDQVFEELIASNDKLDIQTADTGANDPAFMVYTSGTTGNPKGIVHAHRWIVAQGDTNKLRIQPKENDVAMATGEWSFISALGHNVLYPLRNGVTGAILEGRMHPERVLKTVETLGVTVMYSVATVYRRILAIDGVENQFDLTSLRGCNATGEALEAATYTEWFNRIGCPIWEHYGISEMQLVFGQCPHWPIKPGSVGKPLPGTRVEVLDDDYQPVPIGEVGHMLIDSNNPGFFLGYHKDQAKTDEVTHDGWYHTGDLAYADEDGFLWIAGRNDDCFKSRGIFISPIEIENALRQIEGIAEACVVPSPDKEIGNKIRAVVVLKDGTVEQPEQIRAALKERIAPYKVPQLVEFIDELPKSPVGKVLRRALIDA